MTECEQDGGEDEQLAAAPELSVLVAAFNEEAAIEACLRRILQVYTSSTEVLVIDGGHDRTGEIVMELCREFPALKYIRNENDRGKGHAMRVGIEAARGKIMAQIDADLQFLPEELPLIVDPIRRSEADVTLGSRFAAGAVRLPGSTPFVRTMGNKITSHYASLMFFHRMTDVLAGMKAWTRDAIDKIGVRCENCSYDAEIPVKAVRCGLRVIDVPITTDARQGGESCINVVTDGMVILRDMTRIRMGIL